MSLIGISGKIGSGKSTVGGIIQMLTSPKYSYTENIDKLFEHCRKGFCPLELVPQSPWQIKSFAHKIKEIVSILTGCSVKDLEDQDFKNRVLPECWYKDGQLTTYRWLLQNIGTECFRNNLHPDTWVNALFSDYKSKFTVTQEPT